ncbi:MAG: hypothetical protein GXO79_11290 [Chlorobi bacterium]|nr:hypothetical protein [Chlorobiota bacterium]
MEKGKDYCRLIEKNLEIQQQKINPKDYKFYLVGRFLQYARHVEKYADSCVECNNFKSDIVHVTSNLENYLNRSKTNKQEYEMISDKIFSHLSKNHGIKPSNYYTSLYSVFGILAGGFLGLLLSYLFYNGFSKLILFVLLIGFLVGNILGYRKDKKLRTNNLQL